MAKKRRSRWLVIVDYVYLSVCSMSMKLHLHIWQLFTLIELVPFGCRFIEINCVNVQRVFIGFLFLHGMPFHDGVTINNRFLVIVFASPFFSYSTFTCPVFSYIPVQSFILNTQHIITIRLCYAQIQTQIQMHIVHSWTLRFRSWLRGVKICGFYFIVPPVAASESVFFHSIFVYILHATCRLMFTNAFRFWRATDTFTSHSASYNLLTLFRWLRFLSIKGTIFKRW